MPSISKCPKCRQEVTIPDGLDPGTEVRCPLCVVVYPLRDALAEAPPALVPVDPDAIKGPRPDSDALATSVLISERFHVPDSDALAGARETESESAVDEVPVLDAWQEVGVAPEIDTGAAGEASPTDVSDGYPIDTGRAPTGTDAPATFGIEAAAGQYEPGKAGPSRSQRKKKKTKGPIRLVVEVFLGGFGGLLIGYYALCWAAWGFELKQNIPKLPLPLLPHTMERFASTEEPGSGPGRPSPEGNRGVTHLQQGEFDKAIAEFTKQIQLNPTSATTYGNRAGAYVGQGDLDKAIDDYTEAIRLDPELAGAYQGRGAAHHCNGEPDKAIADYDEAIRLNPRYAEAYNGRGDAYTEMGKFDKAIADYDEAIRLAPTDYLPYVNRGEAYEKKGEKAKAEADFAKAKELGYSPE